MSQVFREAHADPTLLARRRIAVLGYGNQGRAQALNLRDSGADVRIGNIDDDYRSLAEHDGFAVHSIPDAVRNADTVLVLLPDEIVADLFPKTIVPSLSPGDALCFASGYNVHFERVRPPTDVDLLLLAPRMVGEGVRELYLSGAGFYSFVGVHQDATGSALDVLLALAWGIGTLRKGAVDVGFAVETELDLFNEQGFGPAFGRVLLTAIQTLIDAGYPKEAVLLEFYLSGEFSYVCKRMAESGLIGQLDDHSQTSQYGAISRGMKFLGVQLSKPMRKILANIRSGKFAREWAFEKRTGKLRYRFLKTMALRQPIAKIEETVRRNLETSA